MYIKIQISDAVYKALVASGKRKRGSIALISPKEGNFNAFSNSSEKRKQRKFIRLAHGCASVGEEDVRMHLCISRRETDVVPARVIGEESEIAGEFVTKNS